MRLVPGGLVFLGIVMILDGIADVGCDPYSS